MNPAGAASDGAASNQYQILGHLASGGMAELYLARAVGIAGFERYVVLKRIMAEHSRNHRFVTMFLDEARLAAQLHHPNIAQVYDIGRVGDAYFFTLEYVHGENCRDLLQRVAALKRQIPVEQTLSVIAGAAAGLHYAHEKRSLDREPLGIVHRDVSPSNLMVSYEGAVKVVDFGIAKAAHRSTETRAGAVKGKVAYMSPEQCTGQRMDRRSDIFSLGIVFYEMSTMTRLFKHPSDFEAMTQIVNGTVPPPTSRRPELSRELEAVILRCLAKRPEDRYQSGAELVEAIEMLAARERLSLSAMSLGRYVRELFGERPEPWYELEAAGEHTGLVTIETTSAGADLPADAFIAAAPRPLNTGGREWLPGPSASLVSAVSELTPKPAMAAAVPAPPPRAAATPPGPATLIPAPPVLPPARLDARGTAAPPVRSSTGTGPRLPLPPPPNDLHEPGSDPAGTVVGPATGPLVLLQPQMAPGMTRDVPDREPSWGDDRDPSWRGGNDVDQQDLRPRRRWIVWSALATAAVGALIIIVASGGGSAESALPVPAGGSAPAVAPTPAPTPSPAAAVPAEPAPGPVPEAVAAPVAAPAAEPAAAPAAAVADQDPAVAPSSDPRPDRAAASPPAVAATPAPSRAKPTSRPVTRAKPKAPRATVVERTQKLDKTDSGDKPTEKVERTGGVRKPPVKCGGLYPPCD